MTIDMKNAPLQAREEHIFAVTSSQRFLRMEGLGNEVPFFICPYAIEEQRDMQKVIVRLEHRLRFEDVRVLSINLYKLCLEILQKNGDLEYILKSEAKMGKAKLLEELQGVLDVEKVIIPAIRAEMEEASFNVLFLTGVGEVFPYIRSHNILNNLQSSAKDQPTLMFFPGQYRHSLEQGASLDLFGRLLDDKYYRAFNIYHCEA